MVTQFPLDPMHLIDLGVCKKMILCILNCTTFTKFSTGQKKEISDRLASFSAYIPKEFARKQRNFDEILRWKATEFRLFILHTGLCALKNIVDDNFFIISVYSIALTEF